MLTRRIIACLDVTDGRVVKGVQFEDLVDAGSPPELAARHAASGADEIVLLDITATHEGRGTLLETVRRTGAAACLFRSPWAAASARPMTRRPCLTPAPTRSASTPRRSRGRS